MNKTYRQILLLTACVIFALLSPLVVFYALGYRLHGQTANPQPVGVLIVESNPLRSDISINGQPLGRTPRSISNLPPGTIELTVKKNDYLPWQKRLKIEPGAVTETRDIKLFPAQRSLKTILGNVRTFSLSPNRELLAALTEDRSLHFIDAEGTPVIAPVIVPILPDDLLWSPDSSSVLITTPRQAYLIKLTDQPTQPIRLPRLDQAAQLAWDQRVPGRLYAITSDNDFIAYNISNQSSQLIASRVHHFATSSRQLFLLDQDDQLSIYNLQGSLVTSPPMKTDQTIQQLHVTPGGHVAMLFSDRTVAVLADTGELLPVADAVLKLGWSPDEQLLLVQRDDTSLHLMNVYDERLSYIPRHELQLVTRLSRPIRNPQWFAGGRHLIYQVDDEILITEIDTRDRPFTYSVDTTNLGDANITVGAQGNVIFYLKKTGDRTRLVAADISNKTR